MEWYDAVDKIRPYVVRIFTPQGSGTGWLVSRSKTSNICAVATAAHVINHAHYWEEPIRLLHVESGKSLLLREPDRSIMLNENLDSAGILFEISELPFPEKVLEMVPIDNWVKPGVEVGWLGFPAIQAASLCFFSGRISAYNNDDGAYLVDGVAINGVSGGPVIHLHGEDVYLLGTVSAYIPNRATGESLPGLAVVRNVKHFHEVTASLTSFDEAKAKETPAAEPPPDPEEPIMNPSSAR